MRHRVFVAVNLDETTIGEVGELVEECRKKLLSGTDPVRSREGSSRYSQRHAVGPRGEYRDSQRASASSEVERQIRFLPPENWHITLSFLGYQEKASVGRIKSALTAMAQRVEPFTISLEKLHFGPPGRPPRMIWLSGDEAASKKLGEIKSGLEDALEAARVPFRREIRPFNAHITLARFDPVRGRESALASLKLGRIGQCASASNGIDLRLPQPRPAIEKSLSLRFEARSLDLMESHLHRTGAEYEIVSRAPLG